MNTAVGIAAIIAGASTGMLAGVLWPDLRRRRSKPGQMEAGYRATERGIRRFASVETAATAEEASHEQRPRTRAEAEAALRKRPRSKRSPGRR